MNHTPEKETVRSLDLLSKNSIEVSQFKDQVIFEESEIIKSDGIPYTQYLLLIRTDGSRNLR